MKFKPSEKLEINWQWYSLSCDLISGVAKSREFRFKKHLGSGAAVVKWFNTEARTKES